MNMRNYRMIFLSALALIMSCRGNVDDAELELVLEKDKGTITADGCSAVTFTVYEGLNDVTSSSRIFNVTENKWLEDNRFSTGTAGTYEFHAEYGGRISTSVTVTADAVVESRFRRNICLMEFTDASCSFCPDAYLYIYDVISNVYEDDNVYQMAFHEKDAWAVPEFATLYSQFRLSSTPSAVVDMRVPLSMASGENGQRDRLLPSLRESLNDYPAHCGLKAVTSYSGETGKISVSITLYSERSAEYYLAAYVVEDGIRGYQLDGSIEKENYNHRHVVRRLLSRSVFGDALGEVASGSEKEKTYSVVCDGSWNMDNTYIYALALSDGDGVNNMVVCPADGGNVDYGLK